MKNEPIYFTAPDGIVYRVYDSAFRNGRRIIGNPPQPWATTRSFVTQDGRRRFISLTYCELHPEISKAPTPDHLSVLFAHSEAGGKSDGPWNPRGEGK